MCIPIISVSVVKTTKTPVGLVFPIVSQISALLEILIEGMIAVQDLVHSGSPVMTVASIEMMIVLAVVVLNVLLFNAIRIVAVVAHMCSSSAVEAALPLSSFLAHRIFLFEADEERFRYVSTGAAVGVLGTGALPLVRVMWSITSQGGSYLPPGRRRKDLGRRANLLLISDHAIVGRSCNGRASRDDVFALPDEYLSSRPPAQRVLRSHPLKKMIQRISLECQCCRGAICRFLPWE